jgi:hypothetical protein
MEMLRKHRKQMTPAEISAVENHVHSIRQFRATNTHLLHEMKHDKYTKEITHDDIATALAHGEVIEVTDRYRALVRLTHGNRSGVCVVISLRDNTVVTTWFNNPTDSHRTLDLSKYQWNIDATQLVSRVAGR